MSTNASSSSTKNRCLTTLTFLASATLAPATTIFSIPLVGYNTGLLGSRGEVHSVFRNFQYELTIYQNPSESFTLGFGSFNTTEAPIERSFLTGDLPSFASLLTNGINDTILVPVPPTNIILLSSEGLGVEDYWFTNNNPSATYPDLHGFAISDITLALDSWIFTTHPPDAEHFQQSWFDSTLQARVIFQGSPIPEPSAAMFGLIGVLRIFFRRVRNKPKA